jgi:hypothetical protein
MNRKTLMQLLDVHWADIKGVDPQALGVITIVLHRTADGNLASHMAANVPGGVVRFALASLVSEWAMGEGPAIQAVGQTKLKKAT